MDQSSRRRLGSEQISLFASGTPRSIRQLKPIGLSWTKIHGSSAYPAGCIVPDLSLGATRRFLLKARSGGPSTVLVRGDLVVMEGRWQRDWRNAVPKQTKPTGMRVSLNFQSTLQMTPEPR